VYVVRQFFRSKEQPRPAVGNRPPWLRLVGLVVLFAFGCSAVSCVSEGKYNRQKAATADEHAKLLAEHARAVAAEHEVAELRAQIVRDSQLLRANTQSTENLSATMAKQATYIHAMETAIQNQTSVTYAALGKVIPVKMPAGFDTQLALAERRATLLAGRKHPSRSKVSNAINLVARLALQLPPWADQEYRPRFNALRWSLASEYLLAEKGSSQQTPAKLDDSAQNILSQLESVPNPAKGGINAPTLGMLSDHLKSEARRLESSSSHLRYDNARAKALACLRGSKQYPAAALDGLQPWLTDKRYGQEATILANRIRPLVAEHQAGEIMKSLARAGLYLSGSPRAVVTGGAYSQLESLKISLASHGLASDQVVDADLAKCKTKLKHLAARQRAKRAEISRAYQAWAMKQIRFCVHRYKADKAKGWYNWQFKDIMHAAISRLLPIRQGDLTVAVQQEYTQAFTKIWSKLNGRADQTQIAEEEAIVRQLSPLDVWDRKHKNEH